MTKQEWKQCREKLDVKSGDIARVVWHWNWGKYNQHIKAVDLRLDFVDDRGITFNNFERTLSYKSLDSISPLDCTC